MKSFHRIKKEIGIKVLEKFNYECINCGSKHDLCVHHINRVPLDSEEYNDINNLTVLCRSCHMSHHRRERHIEPKEEWNGNINNYGRRGKGNPPVNCIVEGCDRLQHGRKLCKKHYEYYRRRKWNNCPV